MVNELNQTVWVQWLGVSTRSHPTRPQKVRDLKQVKRKSWLPIISRKIDIFKIFRQKFSPDPKHKSCRVISYFPTKLNQSNFHERSQEKSQKYGTLSKAFSTEKGLTKIWMFNILTADLKDSVTESGQVINYKVVRLCLSFPKCLRTWKSDLYPRRYSQFIVGVCDNSRFGKNNACNNNIFNRAFRGSCGQNQTNPLTKKLEVYIWDFQNI